MKEELTKEEHGEERAFNPRDNSQPDEAGKKAMAGRQAPAGAGRDFPKKCSFVRYLMSLSLQPNGTETLLLLRFNGL